MTRRSLKLASGELIPDVPGEPSLNIPDRSKVLLLRLRRG